MKLRTMVINQIVYSRACAARYFNVEIMSKKVQSWTGKNKTRKRMSCSHLGMSKMRALQ